MGHGVFKGWYLGVKEDALSCMLISASKASVFKGLPDFTAWIHVALEVEKSISPHFQL